MDRPTLTRALDSAAAQSWSNLEIIVVSACGASHRALPERWRDRPLRQVYPSPDRQLPRPEAANLCLENARGEWLNFLDDDDELRPEHLTTLLNAPWSRQERVICCHAQVVDLNGNVTDTVNFPSKPVRLYFANITSPCSTLMHRSLIDEGAQFDPAFPLYEDYDFYVNLATRTKFLFVNAATAVWHVFAGDSGGGAGANFDPTLYADVRARVRQKWRASFAGWLNDHDGLLLTAQEHRRCGDHATVTECIDRALRLGQQYLRTDELSTALDCLERVLALAPHNVNAMNLCAMANWHAGRQERAQMLLSQAIARLPDHPGLRENLALLRHGRTDGTPSGEQRDA